MRGKTAPQPSDTPVSFPDEPVGEQGSVAHLYRGFSETQAAAAARIVQRALTRAQRQYGDDAVSWADINRIATQMGIGSVRSYSMGLRAADMEDTYVTLILEDLEKTRKT